MSMPLWVNKNRDFEKDLISLAKDLKEGLFLQLLYVAFAVFCFK